MIMEKIVPQEKYLEKAEEYKSIEKKCKCIVILLSLISITCNSLPSAKSIFCIAIDFLVLLVAVIARYFQMNFTQLYRKGEKVRHETFLDNAFGTKLSNSESKGYYDNDDINCGINKLLFDLFESSFFH